MATPSGIFRRGGHRYDVLMAFLIAGFLLAPFENSILRPVIVAALGATLLFALWTSGARRPVFAAGAVVVVVASVAAGLVETTATTPTRGLFAALSLLICLATVVSIGVQLRPPVDVTVRTLSGSLAIYLLSGLAFAYAYSLIDAVEGGHFFAQPGPNGPVSFLYFSFTTLTTVGFGDLSSAGDGAHMLTVLEALFGQLYLVTVVALVVSTRPRRAS